MRAIIFPDVFRCIILEAPNILIRYLVTFGSRKDYCLFILCSFGWTEFGVPFEALGEFLIDLILGVGALIYRLDVERLDSLLLEPGLLLLTDDLLLGLRRLNLLACLLRSAATHYEFIIEL